MVTISFFGHFAGEGAIQYQFAAAATIRQSLAVTNRAIAGAPAALAARCVARLS
jgi:hypothetical protein